MALSTVLRAVGWVVGVAAVTVSGLGFLLALLAAGYTHSGSSPWSSPLAAIGCVLLAGLGAAAAGLGIQQLLKRRLARAFALAAAAFGITVGWYFVWVALWA